MIEHAAELLGLMRQSPEAVAVALDLEPIQLSADCREVDARTSLTNVELWNEARTPTLAITSLKITADKLQDVAGILEKTQRELPGIGCGGPSSTHAASLGPS